jgi:hypothetical protein
MNILDVFIKILIKAAYFNIRIDDKMIYDKIKLEKEIIDVINIFLGVSINIYRHA